MGLDRIERWLERLHLIIICWPLIQWKLDYIPCVHSPSPEDGSPPGQQGNKDWFATGLGSRIFGGENNPALRISNRISVWTARFEMPILSGGGNASTVTEDLTPDEAAHLAVAATAVTANNQLSNSPRTYFERRDLTVPDENSAVVLLPPDSKRENDRFSSLCDNDRGDDDKSESKLRFVHESSPT